MVKASSQRIPTGTILVFAIVISVLFFQSCSKPSDTWNLENRSPAPANISSSACIDIEGQVFGDIIPYSAISLNEYAISIFHMFWPRSGQANPSNVNPSTLQGALNSAVYLRANTSLLFPRLHTMVQLAIPCLMSLIAEIFPSELFFRAETPNWPLAPFGLRTSLTIIDIGAPKTHSHVDLEAGAVLGNATSNPDIGNYTHVIPDILLSPGKGSLDS